MFSLVSFSVATCRTSSASAAMSALSRFDNSAISFSEWLVVGCHFEVRFNRKPYLEGLLGCLEGPDLVVDHSKDGGCLAASVFYQLVELSDRRISLWGRLVN
jgi:hypothetical protein